MPGFGQGPFGEDNFGDWKWSRQVLYDYLPGLHIRRDEEEGQPLLKYAEGLRPSFDGLRFRIKEYDRLRDPQLVRAETTELEIIRLGRQIPVRGVVEQRGLDGSVQVGTLLFDAPTARFTAKDVGKELALVNPTLEANKNPVRISAVISPTLVSTTPALEAEVGPINWELRAFTEDVDYGIFEVAAGSVSAVTPGWRLTDGVGIQSIIARQQFKTVDQERRVLTEKEGSNGLVDANGNFFSVSGAFAQKDVGKKITISGSSVNTNNVKAEIMKVFSSTSVSVSYNLVRGDTSTGGVVYSGIGAELGGLLPEVQHIASGLLSTLSVAVDGNRVTVTLATDGFGTPTSTAQDVVNAVNADAEASDIVLASIDYLGTGRAAASGVVEVRGDVLTSDEGPLVWAVLSRPQIRIQGRATPLGTVSQEGNDLSILNLGAQALLSSPTVRLDADDLGSTLLVRGSSVGNDGLYTITEIVDLTTVRVTTSLTTESGPLFFELRTASSVGDTAQVQVNAQPLLPILARDFGIEIDQAEPEARQRARVAHVTKWINQKGTSDAYRIIGLLSGFDVDVSQLWRIDQDLFEGIPSDNGIQLGDPKTGRSGTAGTLQAAAGGVYQLVDPFALFTEDDVGSQISVSGAAVSSNNKYYTIDTFISSTTVQFRIADIVALPEANNGSLAWSVVRLYTDLPPSLPLYDTFNADALVEYIEARFGLPRRFTVDKFCWETDFTTEMVVDVTAVTTTSPTRHIVTTARGPFPSADLVEIIPDPGTGILPAVFEFYDSAGSRFFLETYPVAVDVSTATFDVVSTVAPVTGSGTVGLVCMQQDFGCGYCAASVALAEISAGSVVDDQGNQFQSFLDKMLDLLVEEAKPAHVKLIPRFVQTLEAVVGVQASGVAGGVFMPPSLLSGNGIMTMDSAIEKRGIALLKGEGSMAISSEMTFGAQATMNGSGTMTISAVVF